MSSTFENCQSLTKLPPDFTLIQCSHLDGSFSYDCDDLFNGCSSLLELPQNFRFPSGLTEMISVFENCSSLIKLPTGFNFPEKCANFSYCFRNC